MADEDMDQERAVLAVDDLTTLNKLIEEKLGHYPLYGFLLYSTVDNEFSDFISKNGRWLNSITGDDCLIASFENPAPWGSKYEEYWKEVLGDDYPDIAARWKNIVPEDRDLSYEIADSLNVDKNALPCIVFIQDFKSNKILYIPIISDKDHYINYFKDIATIVHNSRKASGDEKLVTLRNQWRKAWIKWILPEKIKKLNVMIQEWGSILTETKDKIVTIFDVVSPIVKNVIPIPFQGV